MRPKTPEPSPSSDLFRNRLENLLDQRHALYRLAELIDWNVFDTTCGELYCPDNGCPAKATRLMVGLQYLKHTYGLSDEEVVMRWVENPYLQYFCGEDYFQHQMPIDPSSMSRFRRRIGESGCEKILQVTVDAGLESKKRGIKTQRLRRSLKRRQAIEPVIGHLKSDGLLGRNYLKGTVGDQMNVMLSCAGHNLRLILRQLRIFWLWILDTAVGTEPCTHPVLRSRPLMKGWIAGWNLRWRGINAPTSHPLSI